MSFEVDSLQCAVVHEILATSGETVKKTVYKNTTLVLGRNEFRDILLRMTINGRDLTFPVKDVIVHKKFVKEGKATIKLTKQNVQLLISNCPPSKLIVFLRGLSTKLVSDQRKPAMNARQRLLSDKSRTFQEISPVVTEELETLHKLRAKDAEEKLHIFTPKGKCKRKRNSDEEKENWSTKDSKQMKRQIGGIPKSLSLRTTAPIFLTKEQKQVLDVVKDGSNVFFTGCAGTGKSLLLKKVIGMLPPQHTFATATTGVAACHIGGTTVHAFAGIGAGQGSIEHCIELASRPAVAQQWMRCKHLIIDEISMLDGEFFDKLEVIARVIRQNDRPFGGIQLILCGDFLQLPPVSKRGEKKKFAFQSKAWRKCIDVNIELKAVKRQTDQVFINILRNIRFGRCPPAVTECLMATAQHSIEKDGIVGTRLCTHKENVLEINNAHLSKLTTAVHQFVAIDSDPTLVKFLETQCPVPAVLELKVGAQVMLAKNIDVQKGLVNGARGVVTGFEPGQHGLPIVRFFCGVTCTVQMERWTVKIAAGLFTTRKQLPLKLAWAISIHKSQGMTLDCVEISLARVFECGQAYVALSRARSLQGLRVLDFSRSCVRADAEVLKFYESMHLEKAHQTYMNEYLS